jgi:hypothetical protein
VIFLLCAAIALRIWRPHGRAIRNLHEVSDRPCYLSKWLSMWVVICRVLGSCHGTSDLKENQSQVRPKSRRDNLSPQFSKRLPPPAVKAREIVTAGETAERRWWSSTTGGRCEFHTVEGRVARPRQAKFRSQTRTSAKQSGRVRKRMHRD